MTQSPELAGGEGFTFEGDTAAFYLTALLAEASAPGLEDRTVVQVSVQQRDFGEPLDDVIVDFTDTYENPARLSLQVKRSLQISKAKTNTDFREIVRDGWATLQKPGFRINEDRYGAAVGTVSLAKERALKTICDWARESLTADHFQARFEEGGSASVGMQALRNDVVALLGDVIGAPCTMEQVHQFLAHFVIIQFDFLREGAKDPPEAINRIRECLAPEDNQKAPLLWSRIVQLARASAGKSGQFNRARLVNAISPVARIKGAVSLRSDLERLTELAKAYANLVPDDVSGTRLNRITLLNELDEKLYSGRVIQIRGLPGCGKSVLVKQAVVRALQRGPALFLKAEQLEGTSWISYSTAQGLSDAPLERLLVEVGAAGTPIVFIDAIDRVEREHQPIILDVIRTIMESPLLNNWQVVVSLRDNGIELLRNWLGPFLDEVDVETLKVDQLSDEEAEILAEAKPHLRPLLFGTKNVKDVVRRPFFAKVLNQSHVTNSCPPTFAPQSELDLIENWWRRGGYNETGEKATERQRALIDLASVRARNLSQPIRLSQLNSVAQIDGLILDGILQNAREGISVRFAHDIFFEWAFFYVLADSGPQWIQEIKACGEPPAVSRVVELIAQWEFTQGDAWSAYLSQAEDIHLRSQWLRSWLIGPLGAVKFELDEEQFAASTFTDNFRLFRKTLVWFQAAKTTPNAQILAGGTLPPDQRQRLAYTLGWPSDLAEWQRLIGFTLRRISDVPQHIYPEIVATFEVWQNALAGISNPLSRALLKQCSEWLTAIDTMNSIDGPSEFSAFWSEVPDLDSFRKSLVQIVLVSSRSEPTFAANYLKRVVSARRVRGDKFTDVTDYSPILAQTLPSAVVKLSLAYLCKELPEQQVVREEQEAQAATQSRKAILDKPEAERSDLDKMELDGFFSSQFIGGLDRQDWDDLSIKDNYRSFTPPSPLREPFHSLFQSSPREALRLLRELCNHAMTAWRQLHHYSRDRGTPIPLELEFPWGFQRFWGTDREYLWSRSTWAPSAIGSGFMALEEWCFAELEREKNVDELIQLVVEGNECIAVLGVASMIALHTQKVSKATLPLFTSQRLLAADHNRMVQDLSSTANLIGFTGPADIKHAEAVKLANSRSIRKTQLSWMVPRFLLFSDGLISDRVRDEILNFETNLPFQYEEDRNLQKAHDHLTAQAKKYAELVNLDNYQVHQVEENPDQIAVYHISPSAAEPENVAKAEAASKRLTYNNLWVWASESFEKGSLSDTFTIDNAIEVAKEADSRDLFEPTDYIDEEELLGTCRGAVAATAAMVLSFGEGRQIKDYEWARDVLARAIRLPEKPGPMWSSRSVIPWHQGIYAARGLAAELNAGNTTSGAQRDLLSLVAHPLENVSLVALEEACKLCSKDHRFTWTALFLAFSLCHDSPRSYRHGVEQEGALVPSDGAQAAFDAAVTYYESESGWISLPLPPPAWVKAEPGNGRHMSHSYEDYDFSDALNTGEVWSEPGDFWHSKRAADILQHIPFAEILSTSASDALLDFLAGALDWTNQKNSPPWVKPGRRNRSSSSIFEWTRALGTAIGRTAGLVPLSQIQERLIDPFLALEDENCWALLSPFSSAYVCAYVLDAPAVPTDAIATLDLCLSRFLQASAFKRDSFRSGKFRNLDQSHLIETLMFVSVERADMSARYVNGDWSEISLILPIIDRFVRAGGWTPSVMSAFLTLCERAKTHYPAKDFAEQMLVVMGDGLGDLKGWYGTSIPARIAELVNHFAHRDSPMDLALAQKFLRILDMLVDMGDRRSAALQLSEAFREVRLSN